MRMIVSVKHLLCERNLVTCACPPPPWILIQLSPPSQVETVADSYMMTAGLPDTAERHAEAVTNMAFDMMSEVTELNKQGLHKDKLEVWASVYSFKLVSKVVSYMAFVHAMYYCWLYYNHAAYTCMYMWVVEITTCTCMCILICNYHAHKHKDQCIHTWWMLICKFFWNQL